uniref:Uncharacterized protein n=2 Tax=Meloidogyne TaxID=189290 RepID=A0A6V7U394_MELEN|nr:unnamed protein product [Meloidogyne enterolobii]
MCLLLELIECADKEKGIVGKESTGKEGGTSSRFGRGRGGRGGRPQGNALEEIQRKHAQGRLKEILLNKIILFRASFA